MILQLPGYCEIPLWEVIPGIGDNFHPETRVWRICGYTIVDSDNYRWLNQYRWIMHWNSKKRSYYVRRLEKLANGKYMDVYMAREVLGLPQGAGYGGDQADHKNHDTLNNIRSNLRVGTYSQNQANRGKKYNSVYRFKGIRQSGTGFHARFIYQYEEIYLKTVRTDVEAALLYNYAIIEFQGDFALLNEIPEDEMPSEERQQELRKIVTEKLTKLGLLVSV